MPSITAKTYKDRKLQAAQRAISAARATVANARGRYSGPVPRGSSIRRGRDELKVIENAATQANFASAGSVALYNGVAQGTDFTNRIGRKVIVKSIHFKAWVSPATSTDSPGDICRLMLVWDKQANSAAPAVTDILTTADPFSGVNLNNRDRFKVMYDRRVSMNPAVYAANVITGGNPITVYREKFIKCNQEVIFSGTGATVASIQTGSLYLLFIDLNGTLSLLTHYCRVRFSDA